jgi:hypothetical protein
MPITSERTRSVSQSLITARNLDELELARGLLISAPSCYSLRAAFACSSILVLE